MSVVDVILRLLGRDVAKPPAIQRADRVLDSVAEVHLTIIPKRDAELRGSFQRAGHRLGGR